MMSNFEYGTPEGSEELKLLGAVVAQCFVGSPEEEEKYLNLIGLENIRTLRQGNQIAGGLGTIPMSQWWGEKKVSMTGIGAVAIAPEYRGGGVAVSLMQETIKELYTQGVSTSVLYPAVQRLYRKVGYEQAGSRFVWEVPTNSLDIRKELSNQVLPLVSISPGENKEEKKLRELYSQQAQSINGHLERHNFNWHKIVKPSNVENTYAYLFGSSDKPEGYVIFYQHEENNTLFLNILDWIVLTPAAAYTFWNLVRNHSSQIGKLRWRSSSIDLLTLLLPQQNAKVIVPERWMLRIVNVVQALSERGYPRNLETELHLQVEDDLIPENNGKFILAVKDGCGKVTKGGKGKIKLDIKSLATLYSGLFSAYQLQILGKLSAPLPVINDANQIFTGTTPWMRDFF
ncbi:MAG: enhanced intracellular survival protein Eis [Mastigocoleus sp.]